MVGALAVVAAVLDGVAAGGGILGGSRRCSWPQATAAIGFDQTAQSRAAISAASVLSPVHCSLFAIARGRTKRLSNCSVAEHSGTPDRLLIEQQVPRSITYTNRWPFGVTATY